MSPSRESLTVIEMNYREKAQKVIQTEMAALQDLIHNLDASFDAAIELLRSTLAQGGKIVIIGVGKSHNIGHKIAATLNSTGATSVVLHSQNALHGDLGIISDGDAVIALSYSGETEVTHLLPHIKRFAVKIIAITSNPVSTLGENSDITLNVKVEKEACPLNLAPTSSSTATLVMGDALAMVLLEARGFNSEDFARLHPGGKLGRQLLTKVTDIMRPLERLAIVNLDDTVDTALNRMTQKRTGTAIIVDNEQQLLGVFSQGDFVRAFQKDPHISQKIVSEFMTKNPISISENKLAVEVLKLIEENKIDDLIVVDTHHKPKGLVDTQDVGWFRLI